MASPLRPISGGGGAAAGAFCGASLSRAPLVAGVLGGGTGVTGAAGTPFASTTVANPALEDAVNYAAAHDVVVVASAANRAEDGNQATESAHA